MPSRAAFSAVVMLSVQLLGGADPEPAGVRADTGRDVAAEESAAGAEAGDAAQTGDGDPEASDGPGTASLLASAPEITTYGEMPFVVDVLFAFTEPAVAALDIVGDSGVREIDPSTGNVTWTLDTAFACFSYRASALDRLPGE